MALHLMATPPAGSFSIWLDGPLQKRHNTVGVLVGIRQPRRPRGSDLPLDDRECRSKEADERRAAHRTLDAQVRFRQSPSGSRVAGVGGGQAPAPGRDGRALRPESLL